MREKQKIFVYDTFKMVIVKLLLITFQNKRSDESS